MRRLAHLHNKAATSGEAVWHVQLALIAIIVLQLLLEATLTVGPKYIVAGTEFMLLLLLMLVAHTERAIYVRRTLAILLTCLISIMNVVSLILVIGSLFGYGNAASGKDLLISAGSIYVTNILVFGLWYWEMDFKSRNAPQDFLFAQLNAPEHAGLHNTGWKPAFLDYLYVSVTNATAFSPTDTMPLTHRAKALMAIQSIISLVIVVLVTARAVSIIG